MKFIYWIIFIVLCFRPFSYSQNVNHLKNKINSYQTGASLKHAQWSVYAEYVENGKVIIDLNGGKSLTPASGLKLLTTAAALDILGEKYKFKTRLYYDGKITSEGILEGNLYILGGGDPTLGSNTVKGSLPLDSLMMKWTSTVIKLGVKKINGAIYADDFLFDNNPLPDNWFWVDIGNYYGAGTSALCINENLYYLYFKPGSRSGSSTKVIRTEPEIPGLKFINYIKTGRRRSGDNGYIYCAPGQFTATLRGTIPSGVKEFSIKGSIPDPALFSAQYFHNFLLKSGIAVSQPPARLKQRINYNENKKILTTYSLPLKDIVYMLNKRSINLYAEQLLKTIALKENGASSFKQGVKVLKNFLKNNEIPVEGLHLYDGSGLSPTNTITTKTMVKLLSYMSGHQAFNSFYNSLGIAGDPDDIGFFSGFGAGSAIANNARIKSGLITNVRSHSGYLKTRSGRLIAFSLIANNFDGKLSGINKIHKSVLIMLAKLP
jgi:D-alanyl-D-alanine carboxypeptidase/D-alanyl-D-alanine-endopeptidase (penicillin-binding protein 4)